MEPFGDRPVLTVDCVLFDERDRLLLVERGHPPFAGQLALPGGIVEGGESVEEACRRETREETGLEVEDLDLVGVYSEPGRDPRGHFVTVAFRARQARGQLRAGSDAAAARFVADWRQVDLAFDHRKIAEEAAALTSHGDRR